ncbi:SDR family NAD(P)-dependent oxidoreductase [Paraburkholderia sp. EG285A]|uniref:SDR family NAD(P)-dependent oxidoreductase n=1 Tax=Paraburkholderia sp. EG285A TaxID=3237009 RepID=UPI0034D318EA
MSLFSPDLSNRIALVSGGSRGIGRAIAIKFATAGATVGVDYRQQGDGASAALSDFHRTPHAVPAYSVFTDIYVVLHSIKRVKRVVFF